MSDWLCIDEDSLQLDAYIAGLVADAVGQVTRFLDAENEPPHGRSA